MSTTLSDEGVGPRVVRGGQQRTLGFIATTLISTGGAILLLRYLGVEGFGRYGIVMALIGIVYGISDAGLTITGSRQLALRDEGEDQREVLANVLSMRIVLAGGGVLIAVAFAAAAGYDSDLVLGTLLAGTGTFLLAAQSSMLLPLSVQLRNDRIALNEVLRQGVLVAGFAVLALLGAGLVPFFAVQIVVGVVMLAAVPLLVDRRDLVVPRWHREQLVALIRVGLPIAVANVLGVVYLRVLVVLMSLLSSSERQVGYYVTSTRIVEIAAGLPFLLVTVVLPVLTVAARDDPRRLRYMVARTTEAMALGGLLVALVVSFAAHPIVVALGGSQYEGAVSVLRIQCLAVVTIFITAAWTPALVGLGRTRALVASVGAGLASVILAGVLLIPPHGARGAAIAAVAADLVLCLVTYAFLRRASTEPVVARDRLARIAVAVLPAVAIGLAPGLPDVVAALLSGAVFVGAALALRAIPSELLDGARSALAALRR